MPSRRPLAPLDLRDITRTETKRLGRPWPVKKTPVFGSQSAANVEFWHNVGPPLLRKVASLKENTCSWSSFQGHATSSSLL